MSKNKPTSPQEIFDYKCQWKPNAYYAVVERYSDVWAKMWCRNNLDRHQWSFEKFANPDDSHLVLFETESAKNSFENDYNLYNANF